MKDMVIKLARDRIKMAKGSEKQVEVYPDDVVEALLIHMKSASKSLRDKVIVNLLLFTGVRVSELVDIIKKYIMKRRSNPYYKSESWSTRCSWKRCS